MMNTVQKLGAAFTTAAIALATFAMPTFAAPAFGVQPGVFDPNNACAGIQGKWDNSMGNPAASILLTKPCTTSTFAASYADIVSSLEGKLVSNLTELNFDYKTGEHCGAGAPRFNLQLDQAGNQNAFLGCSSGTQTDLGNGWTHVVFSQTQIQNAIAVAGGTPTSTLYDLYIIFDEGTDTPGETIGTPGTIHIDNVSVNTAVVGSQTSPTSKNDCKNGGWQNLMGSNGRGFKNQGDCVSYNATGGKNLPSGAMTQ